MSEDVISVHLRHAHKNSAEHPGVVAKHHIWTSKALMATFEAASYVSGANYIFFISDDAELVDETRTLAVPQGSALRIITNNATVHAKRGQDCGVREASVGCDAAVGESAAARSIVLDFLLAASGNHMIGTFESSFSRAILTLLYPKAMAGHKPAIVDLDRMNPARGELLEYLDLAATKYSPGQREESKAIETSAWVILADGSDYLRGALTLANSIVETNSKYPVIAVTTNPSFRVFRSWSERFQKIGAELHFMQPMVIPPNIKAAFKHWVGAMQKIQLLGFDNWGPYRFKKLVVIDADSLVRTNIDDAMALPSISGPSNIWGCRELKGFVSNFMVFEPSQVVLERVIKFIERPGYTAGVDQDVIRDFYSQPTESGLHVLPEEFMGFEKSCRCNPILTNVTIDGPPRAVMYSEKPWAVQAAKKLWDWDLTCPFKGPYHNVDLGGYIEGNDHVRFYKPSGVEGNFGAPDSCTQPLMCQWFAADKRAEVISSDNGRKPLGSAAWPRVARA